MREHQQVRRNYAHDGMFFTSDSFLTDKDFTWEYPTKEYLLQ